MQRNKSVDIVNISKSKVSIGSLIDYLDIGMFEEYRVIVNLKKCLFKNDYIRFDFDSDEKFKDFVENNEDLIVNSMWSDFKGDTCMLCICVK